MNIANRYVARVGDGPSPASRDANPLAEIDARAANACHDDGVKSDVSKAIQSLDEEISRAESAYSLMQKADAYLKFGTDAMLLQLGFSALHIAELRRRAGPGGGYPAYSLRNIRETLRMLRDSRRNCVVVVSREAGGQLVNK